MNKLRWLLALIATVGVLSVIAVDFADAQRRGGSMGSRGSRTNSAPPPTATAPGTAAPMNRTMTTPSTAPRPTAGAPAAGAAQRGGLFSRPGLISGLLAGFLGAGLLGMLFGQGLFSNLAGMASILGFVVQLALIGGVAFLALRWWQSRQQPAPAMAGAGGPSMRQIHERTGVGGPSPAPGGAPGGSAGGSAGGGMLGGLGLGNMGIGGAAMGQQSEGTVEVTGEDFDTFERLLGEIQMAFGREDISALRTRLTPEMLSYFSEDLSENASRGEVNEIADVKLLQGDLAESWSEGENEYATVAMRFAVKERMVERATGKVVDGDIEKPVEVTEWWTFMRVRGGTWLLSAIQQQEGGAA